METDLQRIKKLGEQGEGDDRAREFGLTIFTQIERRTFGSSVAHFATKPVFIWHRAGLPGELLNYLRKIYLKSGSSGELPREFFARHYTILI